MEKSSSAAREARIRANLAGVLARVERAATAAGRSPDDIALCAVTKTATVAETQVLADAGVTVFGENRVQAAVEKIPAIRATAGPLTWHMIGNLQRNKVRKALEIFDVFQVVESEKLAAAIDRIAGEMGRRVPVFIEGHTSGEAEKHGIELAEIPALAESIAAMPNLDLWGLMTMAPFTDDAAIVRRCFADLRGSFDAVKSRLGSAGPHFRHLSMGMTNDFELAIAEGATIVRIGSALFAD